MGRVQGPSDQDRLRFNGQSSVHGNNGKDSEDHRLRSNVRVGSLRGCHTKRYLKLCLKSTNFVIKTHLSAYREYVVHGVAAEARPKSSILQ